MVLKTSAIQGNEQSGAEETQIRTAETASRVIAVGGAAVIAGINKLSESMREKRNREKAAPELRGKLYKDFREAFISNGVPKDLASEAAADIVQNKDADSSPAIAEANRIVSEEVAPKPVAKTKTVDSAQSAKADSSPQTASYKGAATTSHSSVQVQDDKAQPSDQKVADEAVDEPAQSSKKVEFEQPPSEMEWPVLQKTAKAISAETGSKPASRKKADVEFFVAQYWKAQQEEKEIAAKPVIRTPIETPEPSLAADYSAGLKAAGADSEIAVAAGAALVDGKDAKSSQDIAKANSQVAKVPERSKLQQMYYDVLAKQKTISPELTEMASKDLAAGKGAHSSSHIRKAHDKILNRELAKSGLDPFKKSWSQYSRHVTATEPKKRDHLIAAAALKGGASVKSAKAMIRWNSPVAAQINKQEGATAGVNYADSVVSRAKVQVAIKQTATGKRLAPVKKKGQGVEI